MRSGTAQAVISHAWTPVVLAALSLIYRASEALVQKTRRALCA